MDIMAQWPRPAGAVERRPRHRDNCQGSSSPSEGRLGPAVAVGGAAGAGAVLELRSVLPPGQLQLLRLSIAKPRQRPEYGQSPLSVPATSAAHPQSLILMPGQPEQRSPSALIMRLTSQSPAVASRIFPSH